MNIQEQEVLQWTDGQVFAKTGKHLDSLQKIILEETFSGQKYPAIAKKNGRGHDRIKQAASDLWKLLSEVLDEDDIKQSTVRSILERKAISNIYNFGELKQVISNVNSHHINICGEKSEDNRQNRSPSTTPHTPQKSQDLSEAPDINNHINFNSQLSTIKQWLTNSIRLITIFGLSGVGKTALALQLIKQIDTQFTHIIWRDLDHYSSLETLQKSLIQFFQNSITSSDQTISKDTPLTTQLITYLKTHPTLIIIDNLQTIFTPQTLAGNYQANQQNYRTFWQKISETCHPSCLLLLSWEKPYDLVTLETKNAYIKTLLLHGLEDNALEICQNYQLIHQETWSELINFYAANPLWLNIISQTIQQFCHGNVADFLDDKSNLIGDLEPLLDQHWERLSELEKQVMIALAKTDTLAKQNFNLKVIQSLLRRGLVEKITVESPDVHKRVLTIFALKPIIKQYIQTHY